MPAREGYHLIVEGDRRKAIEKSLQIATPDDIVLLAGKGHETYQEVHGVKHPFNDVAVAEELLNGSQSKSL
jgi:UDP-N-acetylmuramoyl-L-alanyl-D-glutamate--2,6-diaminopimelate ligase